MPNQRLADLGRRPHDALNSWPTLLALALVLLVAACDGLRANEREKLSTLVPWQAACVGEEPARSYLLKRSGMLLIGVDGMQEDASQAHPVSIPQLHGATPDTITGGAAVAVDERGYWLTAAHCVEGLPMMLITSDGSSMRWWIARVVWNGWEHGEEGGVDMALLHVDGRPFAVMPYGPCPPLLGPVLCRGSGLKSERFSAGKVTDYDETRDAAGCITFYHDAPVAPGDSGGPAMGADGSLAGINVAGKPRFLGFGAPRTTAICPDPAFVRGLIEADAAQHEVHASASP